MAEHLVTLAVERAAGGSTGLLLSGFFVLKYLTRQGTNEEIETVEPLGIKVPRNTEHDVAHWNPNAESIDISFIQVKAIQRPSQKNIQKQADIGLDQAEHDIQSFYAIHPDFAATEKARISFTTMVAIPTVRRSDLALAGLLGAQECEHFLFREDFNPEAKDMGANLQADIDAQTTLKTC